MSTAGYLQDAKNQQKRLAETITAKGITATATEKYKDLVDKVAQIENLKGEERTLENFTNVLSEPKSIVQLEYPEPKNLFNQVLLTDWGLVLTDGKYVGSSSKFNGKTLASNFQNNTQYTISLKGYNTNSTAASVLISVNYTDGTSATIIRLTAQSETEYKFTSEKGKTVSSFKSTYYNADTVNISYIQIEKGTTATPYEPYQGQTYTPTATGEVTGITNLYPTTTLLTDNAGVIFTRVLQGTQGSEFIEILPSSGKNGITKINQTIVDSTIDSNIKPENIKKDVSILGVTGDYICNYTYDETTKELVLIL